jgi:hypothetical protein
MKKWSTESATIRKWIQKKKLQDEGKFVAIVGDGMMKM